MLAAASTGLLAQYAPPDPAGFQGLIVEPYYVADSVDASDTDGSSELVEGAVTYRVFVDLKPGYKLITVGGFTNHPITFNTSTTLFNNDDRGEAWGGSINDIHLNKNTTAIDSWLAMGAASDAHWGVLKTADTDGSVVGGANNDGGSTGTPLLTNTTPLMGIALTDQDGLDASSVPPLVASVGQAPNMFDPAGSSSYSNDNFAWSVLGGTTGPDTANRILIGQFTTDGQLQLCFNLWVRIPDTLVCPDPNCHEIMEFYATLLPSDTAGGGFAADNKFTQPTLCFDSGAGQVDCEGVPNGPAQPGTACDDGDPNTINDTWNISCVCTGDPTSIAEHQGPTITMGPNPSRDHVVMRLSGARGERVIITLRNALGEVLRTDDLGPASGDKLQSIDLTPHASGMYFVDVTVNEMHHVHRITKL